MAYEKSFQVKDRGILFLADDLNRPDSDISYFMPVITGFQGHLSFGWWEITTKNDLIQGVVWLPSEVRFRKLRCVIRDLLAMKEGR
jgi:hypothetical protein